GCVDALMLSCLLSEVRWCPCRLCRAGRRRSGTPACRLPADALATAQREGDVLGGYEVLRDAYATDVRPLLAELREDLGIDPDPIAAYRRSGHQERLESERIGGRAASW
ncbi:MAG TPA: hypothetical protein VNP20_21700, partial [Nocardioidaceae bacterium]|nr:hypothetical protein [Nocardioidaceae bacterium]